MSNLNIIRLIRTPGNKAIVIELSSTNPMEITFNCSIVQSNPVAARVDLLQNEIENIIREKNITSGGQDIVIKMSLQIYEILNILFL